MAKLDPTNSKTAVHSVLGMNLTTTVVGKRPKSERLVGFKVHRTITNPDLADPSLVDWSCVPLGKLPGGGHANLLTVIYRVEFRKPKVGTVPEIKMKTDMDGKVVERPLTPLQITILNKLPREASKLSILVKGGRGLGSALAALRKRGLIEGSSKPGMTLDITPAGRLARDEVRNG